MKLAVVALTKGGKEKAAKLAQGLDQVDVYLPTKLEPGAEFKGFNSSLSELMSDLFGEYEGIICIMALGIVVRVVAPLLEDKRTDPAVLTIDEAGQYAVSTLSGHLGGANQLAYRASEVLDAQPVVTTATDVQDKISFDLLAERLNCKLVPFSNLKLANAALVNGKPVNIFTANKLAGIKGENIKQLPLSELGSREGFPVIVDNKVYDLDRPYLQLVPKNIVVGVGCRRGIKKEQVKAALLEALDKLKRRPESIKALATVDLKEDEVGIKKAAKQLGVPVKIIKRNEIKAADFEYTKSEFVKEKIGVGGVCEPTAVLAAREGRLILSKTKKDGVTIAVVEENFML